jgi:hypothetical protein
MSENHRENPDVRFEKKDVNESSTFWFGVGILVVMVVTAIATKPLYDFLGERESTTQPPAAYEAESDPSALEPPAPRLQVRPELELAAFRAQEDAILASYAWVDKEHGIVRIPVEEAMRLVAERGMPVFESPESPGEGDGEGDSS